MFAEEDLSSPKKSNYFLEFRVVLFVSFAILTVVKVRKGFTVSRFNAGMLKIYFGHLALFQVLTIEDDIYGLLTLV